jgi:predicted membrane protein
MVEIELHLKYLNFMVDDYFLLSIYYLFIDYLFILFFFFLYHRHILKSYSLVSSQFQKLNHEEESVNIKSTKYELSTACLLHWVYLIYILFIYCLI